MLGTLIQAFSSQRREATTPAPREDAVRVDRKLLKISIAHHINQALGCGLVLSCAERTEIREGPIFTQPDRSSKYGGEGDVLVEAYEIYLIAIR